MINNSKRLQHKRKTYVKDRLKHLKTRIKGTKKSRQNKLPGLIIYIVKIKSYFLKSSRILAFTSSGFGFTGNIIDGFSYITFLSLLKC